jgi:hypothetical protein
MAGDSRYRAVGSHAAIILLATVLLMVLKQAEAQGTWPQGAIRACGEHRIPLVKRPQTIPSSWWMSSAMKNCSCPSHCHSPHSTVPPHCSTREGSPCARSQTAGLSMHVFYIQTALCNSCDACLWQHIRPGCWHVLKSSSLLPKQLPALPSRHQLPPPPSLSTCSRGSGGLCHPWNLHLDGT